ncbi:hypothetical protein [Kineosporia sp. A_224]|uniref:hypothetical protein n=1 Tax=Kineosporia sp. A_224 TaxID=1962180 RepID=UPI0013041AB0|nr:hypothetical protein [Kineosporia sp. A_224]
MTQQTLTAPVPAPVRAGPSSWPATQEEVPAWAGTFGADLERYMVWFGMIVASTTGDPDRLDRTAADWSGAAFAMGGLRTRMEQADRATVTWTGPAREAFSLASDGLQARLHQEQDKFPEVASALTAAAGALRMAQANARSVTLAFLRDAEMQRQLVNAFASTEGVVLNARAEYATRLQKRFEAYQPQGLEVVRRLDTDMREVARRLTAATPTAEGIRAWFDPVVRRRALEVAAGLRRGDGTVLVGETELAFGVAQGVINFGPEYVRMKGRLGPADAVQFGIMTMPAGIARNVITYGLDQTLFDNTWYQLPTTIAGNYAAAYSTNWAAGKLLGAKYKTNVPGLLGLNNSITSWALAQKPWAYEHGIMTRPELIDSVGKPIALSNEAWWGNVGYDTTMIGVPAAVLFGGEAAWGVRTGGKGAMIGEGSATFLTEFGVGGATTVIADTYSQRPPEPNSWTQAAHDWARPKWEYLQQHPATITVGAAMSGAMSGMSYLEAMAGADPRAGHHAGDIVLERSAWGPFEQHTLVRMTPEMETQVAAQEAARQARLQAEWDDIQDAGAAIRDNTWRRWVAAP